MYYLDFVTIVRLLKEFRRSGMLQAELPKGVIANAQEVCWLQIKLIKGEIIDYQLVTSRGETIITDQNVLHQVEGLGPLQWAFGVLKEASSMNTSNNGNSTTRPLVLTAPLPAYRPSLSPHVLVPRRLGMMQYHLSSTLTRQQRRVLALVDSQRNVSQITALLFSSFNSESKIQEVLTVLQELEALKIITLQ